VTPGHRSAAMDVDSGTDDRSKHSCTINLDIPLWSQYCPSEYRVIFVNPEAYSGTREVESHAIRGQPSRQDDLIPIEIEHGRRIRDVDNKDVTTIAVAHQCECGSID